MRRDSQQRAPHRIARSSKLQVEAASLTLGAHAPQDYSSCVCVCVCVCSDFSKQQRISQEDLWITSALQSLDLKHVFFFRKTASSRRYRIRVAAVVVGHFACSRRCPSVYPFTWRCCRPRGAFVMGFAIVFDMTLYSARCHWPQLRAVIRLKEDMIL